jgi:hypothetical protein
LATSIGLLGFIVISCTTTYTEADLRAKEAREDADARTEEMRDREIGNAGGGNQELIDEEEESVDRESDL